MPLIELIAYVFTLVGLALIILSVALKNFRSRTNKTFIFFALSVFVYVAAAFISEYVPTLDNSLFWSRTALLAAAFIPTMFYIFTLAFINKKFSKKWHQYLLIFSTLAVASISYSPHAITTVADGKWGRTIGDTGPLLLIVMLYYIVSFSVSFRKLHNFANKSSKLVKLQERLIVYGTGASVFLNLLTQIVLPELGISGFGDIIGIPSIVILVGSVAYAIARHHMFDIKTVLLRSIAFFVTTASLYLTFSIVIFGGSAIAFPNLKLSVLEKTYFVISAFILSILFRPLINLFGKITNRFFYKDKYNPQGLLNEISKILASEIELVDMSRHVRSVLSQNMHISKINIIALNNNKLLVEGGHYVVSRLEGLTEDLAQIKSKIVVTDDEPEGDRKEMLKSYGISVISILKTSGKKVGYLIFGEKLSGEFYTKSDIETIETISDQLSVAIDNAKSYVEIKQFNRTLKSKVSDATHQLKDANESLQQLDKVKDDFISMTSHQLGEPMSAIHGYLVQVLNGLYGPLKEEQQKALEITTNRVRLTKSLVADLLDISRMEVGKFQIIPKPTDIQKVIEEEIETLKFKTEEKQVELKFIKPSEPIPLVKIDEQKTRQVIMNLIDNALYYAAKGHVEVSLESVGNNIVFQVVDDGIGVPKSQQDKLFEKFYRADNAKDVRPDGTGIGLYLAKKVVEDQNGSIIFSSEKGEGSTFGFRLPIRKA